MGRTRTLESDYTARQPIEVAESPALTLIIPTYKRLAALDKCLNSVLTPDLPRNAEVIVVCNGTDAGTEEYLQQLARREPRLITMRLGKRQPGSARNAAVDKARGEVIFFLDDDVTVAPDFFSRAMRRFAERPELDVLGGPNLTPADSGRFEKCVGQVLASPFGSATVRHRFRRSGRLRPSDDRELILCNLIVRRQALDGFGAPFREHMISNEENVLLAELALRHKTMFHDPDLVVYHSRRRNLSGFLYQLFRYGQGRWQNTVAVPRSISPFYLIPVMFLLYLLSIPLVRRPIYLLPLGAYAALALVFSTIETLKARDLRSLPTLLVLFPSCHIAYATGFLRQLLRSLPAAFRKPAFQEFPDSIGIPLVSEAIANGETTLAGAGDRSGIAQQSGEIVPALGDEADS